MSRLPESCLNALRYYTGDENAYPGMPRDSKAYCTLNALFYDDLSSELARSAEGRLLNPDMLQDTHRTLGFCCDLLRATTLGEGNREEMRVYRVARQTDVEDMRRAGQTVSFTSTSKKGFLNSYTDKTNLILLEFILPIHTPQADVAELLEKDDKDEQEVLLPPWLPITFEPRKLTEAEKSIRDRQGNPPQEAYLITVGNGIRYPYGSAPQPLRDEDAAAGMRVYEALNHARKVDLDDQEAYLAWKRAAIQKIIRQLGITPLADILQSELDKQKDMIRFSARVEDLFHHADGARIMRSILGIGEASPMAGRIQSCSEPRLLHTLTTYLLGCHIREKLSLSFDTLPRIFSYHTTGNAFSFFWSLICLCHDLGYCYENEGKTDKEKKDEKKEDKNSDAQLSYRRMVTAQGRKNLLELKEADLLTLRKKDLKNMHMSKAEKQWALSSIELARRYNFYRARVYKTVDHGIAGALLFYDHMISLAKSALPISHAPYRNPEQMAQQPVMTGYLQANTSHKRFRACCLLVALTIARHNMWTAQASDPKWVATYRKYKLDQLIIRGNKDLINAGRPLDQMLYFLDFMDTMDPVKHCYVREVENEPKADPDNEAEYKREKAKWEQRCADRKAFLLNSVSLGCYDTGSSWHEVRVEFGEVPALEDLLKLKADYLKSMKSMPDWLRIRRADGEKDGVTMYFPRIARTYAGRFKKFGITEREVISLCLYEGSCDSVHPSLFYQLPNAYQTFNLLMMKELEGERVRIRDEHQKPQGLYIREWEETLEVLLAVFSAQCKYYIRKGRLFPNTMLFRVDRELNTSEMIDKKSTFAYTSTSRKGYLKNIAKGKKSLTLVKMYINAAVPLLDYQDVLGNDYVYTEEAEVLLPPCLSVAESDKSERMTAEERELLEPTGGKKYIIECGGMVFDHDGRTEDELRDTLHRLRDEAANTLDKFREKPDELNKKDHLYTAYIDWKKAFQALLKLKMKEMYERAISLMKL